jgi:NADH-quinone oxidoreductase subunit L
MLQLLSLFILIPLAGFFISMLVPRKKERSISLVVIGTAAIQLAGFLAFAAYWLLNGYPTLDNKLFTIFVSPELEIFIDVYFDKITAVYAFTGSVLTLLVTIFSRYYLHREEGFKRFFNTMLLFYAGYNIIIFSGNFETLFIGWEFLGISSFLLIAFYRDRYLPVKNGLKVISVYRLSDICLLLAMWLSHHLWHSNIPFATFNDTALVSEQLQQYPVMGSFIAVMLLIAAAAKSAQLPFSSWLPRAMEGPTTSSAIFYGSLSVHIGVFVLLRTYPFWINVPGLKFAVIAVGLVTSVIATVTARVQSSVKTQIAYSSITQIGIIFVEVALGFHNLALIHFAGNAFLRSYQLLVSPSVLSYLVHNQFFHPVAPGKPGKPSLLTSLRNSFYILSVKEWNIDGLLFRYLWSPFKWAGKTLSALSGKASLIILTGVFLLGLYSFAFMTDTTGAMSWYMPVILSFIGLLLVLHAFAERGDARRAWLFAFASQFFIVLAVLLNKGFSWNELLIYLSGTLVSGIGGWICLNKIHAVDKDIRLDGFHGYSYEQPRLGFLFLLCCLGLLGFPITPTFIGVDIMFSHIGKEQLALMIFMSLSFLFIELSVLRIYARVFLGQHKKAYHAIAYRSS